MSDFPREWILRAGTDICRICGNHLRTEHGMTRACRDRHQDHHA